MNIYIQFRIGLKKSHKKETFTLRAENSDILELLQRLLISQGILRLHHDLIYEDDPNKLHHGQTYS